MPSPMSASLNRWRLFHKAEEECRWVLSAGRRAARQRRRANMADVNKRRSDEHGGNPEGQMMALAGLAGEEVPPCQRRQLSRPRVVGVVDCCIDFVSQSERDASVKSAGKLDFTCGVQLSAIAVPSCFCKAMSDSLFSLRTSSLWSHPLLLALPALYILHKTLRRPTRLRKVTHDEERVLILGASSGIGRAIAERYAKRGARVCIVGRRQDQVDEVMLSCRGLSSTGTDNTILGTAADFANAEDLVKIREQIQAGHY